MMREGAPKTIYRKDYKAPDFLIDSVELAFDIFDGRTRVASKLTIQRNGENHAPLVLDGESLEIVSLAINGRALSADEYRYANGKLTIENVPDQVCFEAEVDIVPRKIHHLRAYIAHERCIARSVRQRAIARLPLVWIVPMCSRRIRCRSQPIKILVQCC